MGDMGWLGKPNGELMKLLVENKFDLLITLDKGLEHQQNFAAYPVPIILLSVKNSRYEFLLPLVNLDFGRNIALTQVLARLSSPFLTAPQSPANHQEGAFLALRTTP